MKRILLLIFLTASAGLQAQEFASGDRNFVPGYGTGTSSAGSVTLNTQSGIITSEVMSAGFGLFEQITFHNSVIRAGSVIAASLYNETNSAGIPVLVLATQSAGEVVFRIYNAHLIESFNGTARIYFLVLN